MLGLAAVPLAAVRPPGRRRPQRLTATSVSGVPGLLMRSGMLRGASRGRGALGSGSGGAGRHGRRGGLRPSTGAVPTCAPMRMWFDAFGFINWSKVLINWALRGHRAIRARSAEPPQTCSPPPAEVRAPARDLGQARAAHRSQMAANSSASSTGPAARRRCSSSDPGHRLGSRRRVEGREVELTGRGSAAVLNLHAAAARAQTQRTGCQSAGTITAPIRMHAESTLRRQHLAPRARRGAGVHPCRGRRPGGGARSSAGPGELGPRRLERCWRWCWC